MEANKSEIEKLAEDYKNRSDFEKRIDAGLELKEYLANWDDKFYIDNLIGPDSPRMEPEDKQKHFEKLAESFFNETASYSRSCRVKNVQKHIRRSLGVLGNFVKFCDLTKDLTPEQIQTLLDRCSKKIG